MSIVHEGGSVNPLLEAALGYARRGWPVLPLHSIYDGICTCDAGKECTSEGKHPLTLHGAKDASTDEETLRRWWAEAPTANVGIATAAGPSPIFILGPDGAAGCDAIAELERQFGALPRTPLARSGSQTGRHYYFCYPGAVKIPSCANHGGLPIDLRGEGGLVVAPPSLHKSGQHYAWESSPDEVELAEAPPGLLDWIIQNKGTSKPKKKRTLKVEAGRPDVEARAIAYLQECPPAVSGKGGHAQTFDVARAVVYGFDLGPDRGLRLLLDHYNGRCQPPWTEVELQHKCKEADEKPFDKPRGWLLGESDKGIISFVRSPSAAEEAIDAIPLPEPPPWPTLAPEALHGLAGRVVQAIEPETESDPVAILGHLLVCFGNAAGRHAHFLVEGDRHYPNLFMVCVGESSRGRKGTSAGRVRQVMNLADEPWATKCETSGLSSGEGLIWAVRDPICKREPIRQKGKVVGYEDIETDPGVIDKRLLVSEGEFAQALKALGREGNTLSPVIRSAWDTGSLRSLTKNSPAIATGAHVSIIAHITLPELIKLLRDTEAWNGFANRFLWLQVRRARLLPDGGGSLDLSPLALQVGHALVYARQVGIMRRDDAAARLWREQYPRLTAESPGMAGAVTGRAEAQVLRLSMIYALLDCKAVVEETHLRAALALWDYAEQSARIIFGREETDPLPGLVLNKLKANLTGMTRTDLHNAFARNLPAQALVQALATLRDRGQAYYTTASTNQPGRPAERWFATDERTK